MDSGYQAKELFSLVSNWLKHKDRSIYVSSSMANQYDFVDYKNRVVATLKLVEGSPYSQSVTFYADYISVQDVPLIFCGTRYLRSNGFKVHVVCAQYTFCAMCKNPYVLGCMCDNYRIAKSASDLGVINGILSQRFVPMLHYMPLMPAQL